MVEKRRILMNAIELLKADHKAVAELFRVFEASVKSIGRHRLGASDESAREIGELKQIELTDAISKELIAHMMVEEELFYPAAREVIDIDYEVLIDEAVREHTLAKKLIGNIRTLSPGIRLEMELKLLKKMIEHHVDEEEKVLFPKLEAQGMELINLGDRMKSRKEALKGIL